MEGKKPSNKGSKGLANKWQSHQAQAARMMDHKFINKQMGLEEVNGLTKARKERNSIRMGSV